MKFIRTLSIVFLTVFLFSCGNSSNESTTGSSQPVSLTKAEFLTKVFDYTKSNEWAFAGDKPCVIDFYADWCKPCKMVAPILDELATQYKGKVNFYKINIDNEKELAQTFGIQSIPSILFVPMKGQPQMSVGVLSKEDYAKAVEAILNAAQTSSN
jgi:thioredoxin 1